MLLRFDVANESCTKILPCSLPGWSGCRFMQTTVLPTFISGLSEDNMFYTKPEKLLKNLRQIDKVVPDKDTGSYFINLNKTVQLFEDD
jgi:hypothetical protein